MSLTSPKLSYSIDEGRRVFQADLRWGCRGLGCVGASQRHDQARGLVPLTLGSSHPPLVIPLPAWNPNTRVCRNFSLFTVCLADASRSIAGIGVEGEREQSFSTIQGSLRHYPPILTFFFLFSLSLSPAALKPPDVTCIPKVRSIQMIVHPTPTPIRAGDGHRLTLEDIYDLSYHLELQVNRTYQMVNVCCTLVFLCLGSLFPLN